jgi:hypothetical protein
MESKVEKRTRRLIIWGIIIGKNLPILIFFGRWAAFSYIIAIEMPKANGQPFIEMGDIAGIPLAFITTISVMYLYTKGLLYLLNKQGRPEDPPLFI